ncbi:hypothetical protein [Natrinema hispanicum]|uniref:Membrane associated serine protease, rhomboid family n=1 Tax=Natrinema hispanicum TaxID=392421 RepID=A0A1I0F8P8_9EURY|nr:hypothetical protein [Natrinema hispanicum]SET54469.1 Membrane associated serine protease, rhomboid family [Natrinema hispanicum]
MAESGIGIGNILSGIIGASAVIIVAYLREYLRKRTKRRKIRSALYAEIQATNTLGAAEDMLDSASGSYFYIEHDFIPTNVYQSNLADIGLLSEDEIEKVVEYYTNALIAKEERAGCSKVENDDDASLEQRMSAAGTFKSTISYLQDARQEAMESLECHMDTPPNDEESSGDETPNERKEPQQQEDSPSPSGAKELAQILLHPWRNAWQRASAIESVLAFLLVPSILTAVEASVDSQAWALPLSAESILQPEVLPLAFTSSYVHAGPSFLWGNVQAYLLIMSALFPLAIIAGYKRELLAISLFNLLIVPFLASWVSLILPGRFASGFSGVNAAFLGTLFVFLFVAWGSEEETVTPIWSLVPGLISLSIAFGFASIVSPRLPLLTEYVAGFGIVGTILLVYFFRRIGFKPLQVFSPYRNSVLFWGVLISVIGFAGLFLVVSPSTNVLAHLTGFYVGFFIPFSLLTGRTLNRPIVENIKTIINNI